MSFDEFLARLQTEAEFADLDHWTITEIASGNTSPYTCRLQSGDKDYFVKETKDNERDILKQLIRLELTHIEKVIFPDLLDENILVTDYISGGTLRNKSLEAGLIRDFAAIQNHLNSRVFTDVPRRDEDCYFGKYLNHCCEEGYKNLLALRKHNLAIVERFIEIADHLLENQEQIAREFSEMPFARQHHDFREANIAAKSPQKILDWGSSYGHGPFLFDLAPFLFSHEKNLAVFIEHSDICKQADRSAIERWLYVATCARFMALLTHINALVDTQDRENLEAFLAYHYRTYGGLRR